MKILVGYDGSDLSKRALALAKAHARVFDAKIYVLHSVLFDWPKEEYEGYEKDLEHIRNDLEKENFSCETILKVANLMPGEHLVQFAKANNIDEIIIGVRMRSKVPSSRSRETAVALIFKPMRTMMMISAAITVAAVRRNC